MSSEQATMPASWSGLFSRHYGATAVVLAGSTAVFAINTYVVTSMLPSMLADIGGERFFAWTATTFLVAAVFSAMLVTRTLDRFGTRGAMLVAQGIFALGSLGCALSPDIAVLLVSRLVQGFGGGLMGGLSMTLMRVVLPTSLWPRMFALISVMWGVGNLGGPALGGMFAQLGAWRWGFGMMVVVAGMILLLALVALPSGRAAQQVEPVPVPSLLLLTGSAAVLSVAGVLRGGWTILAIVAGVALAVGFVLCERAARHRILPVLVFDHRSSLRWCYLGIVGLVIGLTTETFVPLFGQQLGGLSPLLAGFLGGALSVGWSVGQIAATGFTSELSTRVLRLGGALALVVGLAATAWLQEAGAGPLLVITWAVTLFVGGAGIGVAWSRFAFAAMTSTDDEEEGRKASAGLSVVQTMTTTFGSAVAGVLVSLGSSPVAGARLLYGGVAMIGLLGVASALRLRRPRGDAITD